MERSRELESSAVRRCEQDGISWSTGGLGNKGGAGSKGRGDSGTETDGGQVREHPLPQPVTSTKDQSVRGLCLVREGRPRMRGCNGELNRRKLRNSVWFLATMS